MNLYTEQQMRDAIKMARNGARSEDNIIDSLNFIKQHSEVTMSNNKQSMKTHLTTATILISLVLLIWAMAKIDAVFFGVLALSVLGTMYAFIYLTIIRNKGGNK